MDHGAEGQGRVRERTWNYEEAFARHRGLISAREQETLRRARVAIVGCGGVGGSHLITLGRLGIGRFTLSDLDVFELPNMNRQYGARVDTLGQPKLEVMAREIRRIQPDVDLRLFANGVQPGNISDFLDDADLFVDGIDFFEIDLRRLLFAEARRRGIFAITAGPIGFSTAWLVFDPAGMSFDDYFDLKDEQTPLEKIVAFAIGLTPALLQQPYIDLSEVNLLERRGPSAGLACELCAGVVGAQAVKILLGRPGLRPAPYFAQFDAYRGKLRTGRLWRGNRHPLQQAKRWWLYRKLASAAARSPAPERVEAG